MGTSHSCFTLHKKAFVFENCIHEGTIESFASDKSDTRAPRSFIHCETRPSELGDGKHVISVEVRSIEVVNVDIPARAIERLVECMFKQSVIYVSLVGT